jgi:uncharacterized protein YoxC
MIDTNTLAFALENPPRIKGSTRDLKREQNRLDAEINLKLVEIARLKRRVQEIGNELQARFIRASGRREGCPNCLKRGK